MNILVVDDIPEAAAAVRIQLTRLLRARNTSCTVRTALTMVDALIALENGQTYDLIVVDGCIHKAADGVEVIARARAQGVRCPIIMSSGTTRQEIERHAARRGLDASVITHFVMKEDVGSLLPLVTELLFEKV